MERLNTFNVWQVEGAGGILPHLPNIFDLRADDLVDEQSLLWMRVDLMGNGDDANCGKEILAYEKAGITVTLPKPLTSGSKAKGRFGKQDFVYLADEDVYRCPAGERLVYRFTNQETD